MALMPGASRVQRFTGNRHHAPIDKVVVHTTEGSSWPGYGGGAYPPHFTARPGKFSTTNVRQHIDTAQSAKALENRAGGVQTNNDGCVQVEMIGSCDKAYAEKHGLFYWPSATDADLGTLVEILVWAHRTHGVPLTTRSLEFRSKSAYGLKAPQRISMDEWRAFSGVCGHQHVPENAHWDPGEMPVKRAVELARRIVNGASVPTGGGMSVPAPSKPAAKPKGLTVDGRFGHATVRALQRWLGDHTPSEPVVDGKAGHSTWRAVQRWLGTPVDGVVSRQSYRAEELGNGITQGWLYTGRGSKGSTMVRALQKTIGATADGVWGTGTTRALQVWLNGQER